jgi:hypothetical protein
MTELEPLIHWYDDHSSLAYNYVIYASKNTIHKANCTPMYFEYAKQYSDLGTIVVIVFNKTNIDFYKSYIYTSSIDEYWSRQIYLDNFIDYYERYNFQFNICDLDEIKIII